MHPQGETIFGGLIAVSCKCTPADESALPSDGGATFLLSGGGCAGFSLGGI